MPDHKAMTSTTTPTATATVNPATAALTKDTVVGYYVLPQDTVFHNASYECAAWWTDTLVKAGRYPVHAILRDGHVDSFSVALPGTVTEDYFPALFCGNLIGKPYNTKANAGKPSTHYVQVYSYDAVKRPDIWDLDYSLLPYVGRCLACGCRVFGYKSYTPVQCPSCGVFRDGQIKAQALKRFPRVIAAVASTWEFGNIAATYVAKAVYERDTWARPRVASALRRVRLARRMWPQTKTAGWLRVGDVDRWGRCSVQADGHHLGYLENQPQPGR